MERRQNGYLLDVMPSRAQCFVKPIVSENVQDFANLEEFADDPDAVKMALRSLIDFKDTGPYYDSEDHFFDGMLGPDQDLVIAAMRAATYTPILKIPMHCYCETDAIQVRWQTTIATHHLPIVQYPEEVLAALKSEDALITIEPFGFKIKFTAVAQPSLEEKPGVQETEHETFARKMAQVIRYVDSPGIGKDREAIKEWVKRLPVPAIQSMNQAFLAAVTHYGLPNFVERRCPKCGKTHIVELPFGMIWNGEDIKPHSASEKFTVGLLGFAGSSLFQSLTTLEKQFGLSLPAATDIVTV